MKKVINLFMPLLLATCLLIPSQSRASHAMGAEITYRCISNNQYEVTLTFFRDCFGVQEPDSILIDYFSPSCNISPNINTKWLLPTGPPEEVVILCSTDTLQSACNGGAFPGQTKTTYQGIITLPSQCPDWVVGFSICCRNNAITNLQNAASASIFTNAIINNTSGICNNSPVWSIDAFGTVCAGQPFEYNPGIFDSDGDSLVISMIPPSSDYLLPIQYTPPFNANYPLNTVSGTVSFNSTTGQFSFTPSGTQVVVITLQVEEYRNGVLIGSSMRDIQIRVLDPLICAGNEQVPPPDIDAITGGGFLDTTFTNIQMCPNNDLALTMISIDIDGDSVILKSNSNTTIPGSNFSIVHISKDTALGLFTWTPTITDTGFHQFQLTYSDDGCPFSIKNTITYEIHVFNRVIITSQIAGKDTLVFCGNPIQLNAVGGSFFNWSPVAGLNNPNIHNPIAAPAVSTMYYATSDCGIDSVFIDVQPSFAFDAGDDTSVCLNSKTRLSAFTDPAFAPYIYEWSPANELDNPATFNTLNPLANPSQSTTFQLKATSILGCVQRDTVRVNIQGIAPNVTVAANPDTVCLGEITRLNLSITPAICGLNVNPCNTPTLVYDVGTDNIGTIIGTPYAGGFEDSRVQYLFTVNELNILGLSGGTLTEIAFNISQKSSLTPYNNFTIKMGCTNLDILTTPNFILGTQIVFGPANYSSVQGWNNHVLDTPYDWDGVNNLIIEVCYDNQAGSSTADDEVFYTTTTFASTAYQATSGVVGCDMLTADLGNRRPNVQINICQQTASGMNISWNPSGSTSNPNIENPQAQVFGTTEFIVAVDAGGCVGQGFVNVVVDTNVTVIAEPDTSLCIAQPIQLSAQAFGTPSTIPLTCGINGTQVGATTTYEIGSTVGITSVPSPYRGSFHSGRMQILVKASELTAFGISRGIITSAAFDIRFKNSTQAFKTFTILMGCSNLDILGNTFETGLGVVFNSKDVTTSAGWNTHAFDNPYDWDGFSNIIIEINFTNTGVINEELISYATTAFNSVLYASADFSLGGSLGNPTSSTQRPTLRLNVSPPPAGAYTYLWSPATDLNNPNNQFPIASPTTDITYTVTVTDGICFATDTVSIAFYTDYDINVYGSNLGCNGISDGDAVSIPNGGVAPYDFIWNNGQQANGALTDTLFNLNAGTYFVTVTDNNRCTTNDSVTITVPLPLGMTLEQTDISCFGADDGTAGVMAFGGTSPYTYGWSGGTINDSVATDLSTGNYYTTLTDASGCRAFDSLEILEPNEILYVLSADDVKCFGGNDGSATILVSGGSTPYTYLWNDGQLTMTAIDLSVGMYVITSTDSSGCNVIDSILVAAPDSLGIIINTIDVSCFGLNDGVATASVLGDTINYTFLWLSTPPQNNATATGLPAGRVDLEVMDTNTCQINSFATISFPDSMVLTTSTDSISCFGGNDGIATVAVVSGGTAPFSFSWNNGQTGSPITGLSAGNVIATATDSNGCTSSQATIVYEPAMLSLLRGTLENILCFDSATGLVEVIASGGTMPYDYSWNDGQLTSTADSLIAGIYSVSVMDKNGCLDSLTGLVLSQPTALSFSFLTTDTSCSNESTGAVSMSASGGSAPYIYFLNAGGGQPDGNFTNLFGGNYDVSIEDANNCFADSSVLVHSYDSIVISFNEDELSVDFGEGVMLQPNIVPADTASYDYNWIPTTGLSCTNCLNPIASPDIDATYQLQVTANNCIYVEEVTVKVINDYKIPVPSAFSPNDDGLNEILYVYLQANTITSFNFKVFNRWGEKVFESIDLAEGWDGTYIGEKVPTGVYLYYVEITFSDGTPRAKKGSVTLLN